MVQEVLLLLLSQVLNGCALQVVILILTAIYCEATWCTVSFTVGNALLQLFSITSNRLRREEMEIERRIADLEKRRSKKTTPGSLSQQTSVDVKVFDIPGAENNPQVWTFVSTKPYFAHYRLIVSKSKLLIQFVIFKLHPCVMAYY